MLYDDLVRWDVGGEAGSKGREYIEATVAINSLFQMKKIGFLKDKNYNLLKKKCMSSIVQYIFKS